MTRTCLVGLSLVTVLAACGAQSSGGNGSYGSGGSSGTGLGLGGGIGSGTVSPVDAAFCAAQVKCQGGDEKAAKRCEAWASGARGAADAWGCVTAYEASMECESKTLTCTNGKSAFNCDPEENAVRDCELASSCMTSKNCSPSGEPPPGDIGAYCFHRMVCVGGNDKDVAACLAQVTADRDVAAIYDCSGPFDTMVQCAKSVCSADACTAASKALDNCMSAAEPASGP